jgi:hypothetical protein
VTTDSIRRSTFRLAHWLAPGFLLLWILGTSAATLSMAAARWPMEASLRAMKGPDYEKSMNVPGIRHPAALPASEVPALADDEPVVGVSVSAHHRAYLIRALAKDALSHIVNDVLNGIPLSVTHCNLHACTRAFTGGSPGEALDISQGGLKAGSMVLRSGGHCYRQDSCEPLEADSPSFPYQSHPADVTTWGAWRLRYPDTDVYLGEVPVVPETAAMPSSFSTFLGEFLFVGAAPLLILFVTLLVHVLLALLLSAKPTCVA